MALFFVISFIYNGYILYIGAIESLKKPATGIAGKKWLTVI